ncbi:MAG: NAD(P)/FAD-dependent oxidoreductase [Deltaproteobacteria bacterium]|nr:NAD(P)/FAD-dependent oxidoreductase [Deltaproteobacteria bacterium]
MNDSPRRFDVAVIGSGAGGLTAALTVARRGYSVVLLEAAQQFGGYLNPFARKKFVFDTGVHYVGEGFEGGSLQRIYRSLELDVKFNELNPDGFDWYVFPGYQIKLGKGIERFCQRLKDDFPHETSAIDRFFALLKEVEAAFRTVGRVRDLRSGWEAAKHLPALLRWRNATFAELLDHYFDDKLLKCALSGPCGDLGLPPGRISALYHIGLLLHYLKGAFYPRGGSGSIRDAYVEALQAKGALLKRNTAVESLLHSHGRVNGVRTQSGETFLANVVISNAEAVATFKMADLHSHNRRIARRIRRIEPSYGSFMVFLGLKANLSNNPIQDANVWHYDDRDIDRLYARVENGELPSGEMMFITIPTLKDPQGNKAPSGHHIVEIVTLVAAQPFARWFGQRTMKRDQDYNDLKRRIADPLIERAALYVPELRSEEIVVRESSTPATNSHYIHNRSGAIYGPAHTPNQVFFRRFAPTTPLEGLLLCGSSVLGAGVAPCTHSGYVAGKLADHYLQRRATLRGRAITDLRVAARRLRQQLPW